jgi:adenosylhomocysteinase
VAEGAEVHAVRGEDAEAYAAHVASLVAARPQITLDDGADLLTVAHAAGMADSLLAGTEETTTGLLRIRALAAEGRLACPVVAVNEAWTERLFNDRYGTGQSALDGILRATNLLLAGRTMVVLGYGVTGQGVAQRAPRRRRARRGLRGGPAAGPRGVHGGLRGPARAARRRGRGGLRHRHGLARVLGAEHVARMRDGAVLANAGTSTWRSTCPRCARRPRAACGRCCRSWTSTCWPTGGA